MTNDKLVRIMFVCMGNICRSPLAEGVLRHQAREAGVLDHLEIASSGTGAWHVGQAPDRRMTQTAKKHGVSLDGQRAQQFEFGDLSYYDYIFAMDSDNLGNIKHLDFQDKSLHKIALFRSHDSEPGDRQVPDPYYGGPQGFEHVYEIVERTCKRILEYVVEQEGLTK